MRAGFNSQLPPSVLLAGILLLAGCRAAPAPAVPWTIQAVAAVHWAVPPRFQEDPAACGPCALWSVLAFHSPQRPIAFATLDRALRPPGSLNRLLGVLPGQLADFARRAGFAASVTTGATLGVVRRSLDHGLPVILLGEYTVGDDSRLHYVVVTGYQVSRSITTWWVSDPLVRNGVERRLSTPDLMAFWDDVRLFGRPIPYQRTIVTVAPSSRAPQLPPDNRDAGVLGLERLLQGVADLFRGPAAP